MGFLKRAIRNAVNKSVSNAVNNAVQKAVEPTATKLANKAAEGIDSATRSVTVQQNQASNEFNSAFSNLERAAKDYATEMGKNLKVCPSCGESTSKDKTFCPSCGTKLPEQTVAEGAVCSSCTKQNTVGTKFCAYCGTKLPAAIMEEQANQQKNDAVMAEWNANLSAYPKWSCGGSEYHIEPYDNGAYVFSARFPTYYAAQNAVNQYNQILLGSGFRQAGQYPTPSHLYKMENGICFHVDTEHCFDGDGDCPSIYFDRSEPTGGFNYKKPETKQKSSWKDLFGLK